MSRQRRKHPEVVMRRKAGRQIDKLITNKMGYVSSNPRGRRMLRLLGVNKKPYNAIPSNFLKAMLEQFIK